MILNHDFKSYDFKSYPSQDAGRNVCRVAINFILFAYLLLRAFSSCGKTKENHCKVQCVCAYHKKAKKITKVYVYTHIFQV